MIPNPIAFRLGPLEVRWYGILMAVALIVGTWLALREARRQGLNEDALLNLIILGAPLGWLGARLYYVIFEWSYYRQHLAEIPQIWKGGLAIHGGLITAVLVGLWYARRHNLDFWQLADIAAPSLILGQAIGRWGNFFNQEAYGYPTTLPWAMYIAGEWRHPTFLYESLWDLGVFVFLLWERRRSGIKRGDVFLAYLVLYSLGRFWVEGLRTDSLMLGPLRVAQVVSFLLATGAGYLLWHRHRAV
ncbi:MAG: phosphatidylglycerol---prolipoprotein diacylglyceryl transferase [Bacillota bacterium]|jgi:phosphatidylglycerol:prolipoprotein diacylglycerol transferase|nr:phosphatidylglycerol---prolipoprotein diacylglyceryl transferase [Bacillota bacterium]MDK2856849.1 phosphatidylglycerol---prolipoprotein diacylglyceryl transferase [Bacillota bacterium]MDK2926179.1 phosphatidylglycerol---prolipoprotein diacylglyceryl transferase [Bacillota bacterium]